MGITPLRGYWSWTAIDLTGSGIRVRHFAFESHRSALMGFAPLYPSYERERSPPGMKKPPGGGFFAGTRCGLELRAGAPDGVGDVELLEVLDELRGQGLGSFVVGSLVSPGVARVEQVGVDARNGLRHVQVDDVQVLGLGTDQGTALEGSDHATGGRDVEALANAIATAGPAGVDQVHLGAEALDALDQQFG